MATTLELPTAHVYLSTISSPPGGKVVLTKPRSDQAMPCWGLRGLRVRLRSPLSTQPCPNPQPHLTPASSTAGLLLEGSSFARPHTVLPPTTGLRGADVTRPPTDKDHRVGAGQPRRGGRRSLHAFSFERSLRTPSSSTLLVSFLLSLPL